MLMWAFAQDCIPHLPPLLRNCLQNLVQYFKFTKLGLLSTKLETVHKSRSQSWGGGFSSADIFRTRGF